MLEPKEVEVNGRKYIVTPFNPIDAYKFYHDKVNSVAYGKSLLDLGLKALGQCMDSASRSLGDKNHFQTVFSEYPEDLIPLERAAKEALLGPFETQSESTS